MRVFCKLMAKWLVMLYVCNVMGNYTAVGNTNGSIVVLTHCFSLMTCDASEHVNNIAAQLLMCIKQQQCAFIHFLWAQGVLLSSEIHHGIVAQYHENCMAQQKSITDGEVQNCGYP